MSAAARAMRRLSARLLESLPTPDGDADLIPLLGQALTTVRGRTVRLPAAAFPPMAASGLWVDRTSHDQILYEENTDPEHQLVVIGHEAWHMFHGDRTDTALHHGPSSRRAVGQPRGGRGVRGRAFRPAARHRSPGDPAAAGRPRRSPRGRICPRSPVDGATPCCGRRSRSCSPVGASCCSPPRSPSPRSTGPPASRIARPWSSTRRSPRTPARASC